MYTVYTILRPGQKEFQEISLYTIRNTFKTIIYQHRLEALGVFDRLHVGGNEFKSGRRGLCA